MSIDTSILALGKAIGLQRSFAGQAVSGASGGLQAPARVPAPAAQAPEKQDRVDISPEARRLLAASEAEGAAGEAREADPAASGKPKGAEAGGPLALSPDEKAQLQELQARDADVRAHENAHAGAGGALAGSPSFTYQQGPDGRQYAVGGEVPIRVQSGGTPEETLRNAAQVRAAALAPAHPSSADLGVAASATALEMQARNELAQERLAEITGSEGTSFDPVGRREAAGPEAVVGEGGSFDSRNRDQQRPPAPAIDAPQFVDLFG